MTDVFTKLRGVLNEWITQETAKSEQSRKKQQKKQQEQDELVNYDVAIHFTLENTSTEIYPESGTNLMGKLDSIITDMEYGLSKRKMIIELDAQGWESVYWYLGARWNEAKHLDGGTIENQHGFKKCLKHPAYNVYLCYGKLCE